MTSALLADVAWDRLRNSSSGASTSLGIPSFELATVTTGGFARLSIGPQGEARLLLPILSGESFPDIGDGPGLMLKDSVLLVQGRPVRCIDMMCRQADLEQVFRDLVADILRRIDSGEPAGTATVGAVSDFRNLLRAQRSNVTPSEVIGLLGELLLLNKLLDENPQAWVAWSGPRQARHDFRASDRAVEVKTSLRSQQRVVEIHAIDQLVAPDGGDLHLACFFVEVDLRGALSVPVLAGRALSKASDPIALRALLSAAGFEPSAPEKWGKLRFSLLSFDLYRVVEGFPRLTPASFGEAQLPPGISHFRYRIDLSAASNFRLAPDAIVSVLKELSKCTSV